MTAGLNNLLNRNVAANVGFIKSHLYYKSIKNVALVSSAIYYTLHISDHMWIDRSSRDTKLDLSKDNQMYWGKKALEPRLLSIDEVYNMWCMVNCTAVMLRHRPTLFHFSNHDSFWRSTPLFYSKQIWMTRNVVLRFEQLKNEVPIGNWTCTIFDMPFRHSEK